MRVLIHGLFCGTLLVVISGCGLTTSGQVNPFLTLTEVFGIQSSDSGSGGGGGSGTSADITFRRTMTVTVANNYADGDLNVSVAAWVYPSSIRSAVQQDALLDSNYVQLTHQVDLGTVFSLPPGTFVYNGPGTAGAIAVKLGAADASTATAEPTVMDVDLVTPDVLLAFLEPPVSCDSIVCEFWQYGAVNTGPATGVGGRKTLAQVDAYECDPLQPGLFFKSGGGTQAQNEFLDGDNVRFDFFGIPDADGNCVVVTVSS